MALSSFYVGATINFAATFTDRNGDPFTPSSVLVSIDFKMGDVEYRIETEMLGEGAGVYTFGWDTEWVDPGVIRWDIRNVGGAVTVTAGRFILKRSAAAPQPVS
jgi:hypothetical protein